MIYFETWITFCSEFESPKLRIFNPDVVDCAGASGDWLVQALKLKAMAAAVMFLILFVFYLLFSGVW